MREKEVRWISRDSDGSHFIWLNKPHKLRGEWFGTKANESPLDLDAYEIVDGIRLWIKIGGLAKITIERQY